MFTASPCDCRTGRKPKGRTFGGCCGSKDFYDARSVAQTLGIPHYSFDYVDKFRGR